MKAEYTIGFDTSNYTTSCAVFDGVAGKNSSRLLDVPQGELGLRQSDALFVHVKRLPEVFSQLSSTSLGGSTIAVGASVAPRETEGSYMPCFLAGASQGEVLAQCLQKPFFRFSHQQGHVAAAAWSAGRIDLLDEPMLCWHLSGGTTELLFVKPNGVSVSCEIVGGTSDISSGQLVDRAGKLLGLSFPSGAALDKLAIEAYAHDAESFDKYTPKADGLNFSLSGVEHKVKSMHGEGKAPREIAVFAFWSLTAAIRNATELAFKRFGDFPLLLSGGVASSTFLRRAMPGGIYASPEFSADNAMGIAILAHRVAVERGELREESGERRVVN